MEIRRAWIALVAASLAGCAEPTHLAATPHPFPAGLTLAVAPALNFSGSAELDPVRVADLFASELATHAGVTVLPVSRVVAVLAREGRIQIRSPAHAIQTAERLGCDGVCVVGITEYQPYSPLVVGLVAQVYVRPGRGGKPESGAAGGAGVFADPEAQVQRVYNSAHEPVADEIRKYAVDRDADQSPYGWRRYMVSQELFLRYCCFDASERLATQMSPELTPMASTGTGD
ncbi:MAG: hypothetical protein U1A27_09895 [Phycisphaerae bacterium]